MNYFLAGNSRGNFAKDSNTRTTSNQSSFSQKKHSSLPLRMPRGSSGTPRGPSGTPRISSGVPRGSPTPHPTPATRSAEKLLPLVTNDLVLAQGSQRALVLTQGGDRCNDYQLQIERRIINKHDLKKADPHLAKVLSF